MITIIKRTNTGAEKWRYEGELKERGENFIVIEAFYTFDERSFMDTTLKKGDRFIETYYSDKWFNIYEIYDCDTKLLKGWYCNIGQPFVWETENIISYIDLALDLWVNPQGKQTVLDEDEFEDLNLDINLKQKAQTALEELKNMDIFLKTKNASR
jgi:protein associated with RNAse G/E